MNRYADIVTNGLPIVNIGKLIGMRDKARTPFGQRMFDARVKAGLSQLEVRKELGLSQSTISGLEREAHSSGHTVAFAKLYRCDPEWLASGEGEHPDTRSRQTTFHIEDITVSEWAVLENYRYSSPAKKEKIAREAAEAASDANAVRKEQLSRLGMGGDADPEKVRRLPPAPAEPPAKEAIRVRVLEDGSPELRKRAVKVKGRMK